MCVTTTC